MGDQHGGRAGPTFFAEPQLFGFHHVPVGASRSGGTAVLICPPIGHEHTRAHRALRLLGQALARSGHHVLRFDYRGLGDSWGDQPDDVEQWCDDIAHALMELAKAAASREVAVVGLRMGASLAVRALAGGCAGDLHVQGLVLWDPVLWGDHFLGVAMDLDAAFLNDSGRFPALGPPGAAVTRRQPGEDLLGYRYSAPLRHSLAALDLRRLASWPAVKTTVIASEVSSECEALVTRLRAEGCTARYQHVAGAEGAWDDYKRHEATLRAGRLIPAIVASLAGGAS